MFLLDTDAMSEVDKLEPDAGFAAWIASVDWRDLHLSAITVAEMREGIMRLPESRKRRTLEAVFDLLPERFQSRIVPVDYSIAVTYGELQAEHGPLPVLDCLIAATALTRRLTIVTRNTRDMLRARARCLDPWTA
jgi:predicted nucleic acid-binding protein